MNNHHFFRYITGDSKIHLMNSKFKTIWLLLTLIATLLIHDYAALAIVSAFLIYAAIESKIDIDTYFKNITLVWPIYIITMLISYLVTFNVLSSALITTKVMLLVLLFLIYTFTTSLSEIAWGFECLFERLKKIKVPVSKISLRIALVIKFISTLFEQLKNVRKSMAYRGIAYSKNDLTIARKMFMPVIRLSYKLSKRTISAMKLRFYGASTKRTNYHENKVTGFDRFIIVMNAIILYVVAWIRWTQ